MEVSPGGVPLKEVSHCLQIAPTVVETLIDVSVGITVSHCLQIAPAVVETLIDVSVGSTVSHCLLLEQGPLVS